jgi:hypothetical protein
LFDAFKISLVVVDFEEVNGAPPPPPPPPFDKNLLHNVSISPNFAPIVAEFDYPFAKFLDLPLVSYELKIPYQGYKFKATSLFLALRIIETAKTIKVRVNLNIQFMPSFTLLLVWMG